MSRPRTHGTSIVPGSIIGLVGLLIVLWAAQTTAQPDRQVRLDPYRPIEQFALNTWTTDDGLPQNVIEAVIQTTDGYLWMATQTGLARFDGIDFDLFTRSTTPALKSNEIEVLMERGNGELWIGTDGGGLVRRTSTGSFELLTPSGALAGAVVTALHEDADGTVWIGTAGEGLYRYDLSGFARVDPPGGFPSSTVLTLHADTSGALWIGTQEGVIRLDDGEIIQRWLEQYPVTDFHRSRSGILWAATHGAGVCQLPLTDPSHDFDCVSPADGLTSSVINTVLEDRSGGLWIGTKGGGLNRLYNGRIDTLDTSDGLPNDKVSALHQDRENSLWIGTSGGGITRLRGTKLAIYSTASGLSHNVVLSILEDSAGRLWIGTDGGGLNRLQNGSVTTMSTADGLPSDHVYALHEDRNGRLWAGFLNEGACVVAGEPERCYSTTDGLSSNTVYSIAHDAAGNLWIGTDTGINRIREGEVRSFTQESGLPHNWVTAIQEDDQGVVWIGTFGGLVAYSDRSFTMYTTEDGLSSGSILTIHEDRTGTLWFGTKGGGVCRRDGESSFRCYTADDGLISDNVLQIQTDAQGRLWTGHLNGIASVPIEQLDALDNDAIAQLTPDTYGQVEANGGTQPVSWRSNNGDLWFATMSGVATIDPAHIPRNTVPPPVHIEEVLVEEEVVDLSNSPELPPRSKDFEFHYTGLSFVEPEEVTFEYKLEGYDDHWIDAGSRRRAFYTNVPPGEYTFRVRAYNNAGIVSEADAAIGFTVEPFFYQTYWFYALCGLGVVFLPIGINHLRMRRLRAQREKLSRLVDEQTKQLREREEELEELNADLEEEVQRKVDTIMTERSRYEQELIAAKQKAEESARLKSNILMNMSHEIRTPLTSILGFVDILSDGVPEDDFHEFAEIIHNSGQRLLETVNSVLEMSELKAGSTAVNPRRVDVTNEVRVVVDEHQSTAAEKGLNLQIEQETVPIQAHVDPVHLERTVAHLVSNAIKYTEEGDVTVRTQSVNGHAVIEVEDEGQGIKEEFMPQLFEAFKQESSGATRTHEGIGLGLTITRHLVEMMDAEIEVETEKGVGSCFRIRLPRKPSVSD